MLSHLAKFFLNGMKNTSLFLSRCRHFTILAFFGIVVSACNATTIDQIVGNSSNLVSSTICSSDFPEHLGPASLPQRFPGGSIDFRYSGQMSADHTNLIITGLTPNCYTSILSLNGPIVISLPRQSLIDDTISPFFNQVNSLYSSRTELCDSIYSQALNEKKRPVFDSTNLHSLESDPSYEGASGCKQFFNAHILELSLETTTSMTSLLAIQEKLFIWDRK